MAAETSDGSSSTSLREMALKICCSCDTELADYSLDNSYICSVSKKQVHADCFSMEIDQNEKILIEPCMRCYSKTNKAMKLLSNTKGQTDSLKSKPLVIICIYIYAYIACLELYFIRKHANQ